MSNEIQMDREEIYEKLRQAYARVAFIHQRQLNLPEATAFTDLLRKRRQKIQEIRGNTEYSFKNLSTSNALAWMSQQYQAVIEGAIQDAFAMLSAPPCLYAILSLGPISRLQATPSDRIQFAVLLAVS